MSGKKTFASNNSANEYFRQAKLAFIDLMLVGSMVERMKELIRLSWLVATKTIWFVQLKSKALLFIVQRAISTPFWCIEKYF